MLAQFEGELAQGEGDVAYLVYVGVHRGTQDTARTERHEVSMRNPNQASSLLQRAILWELRRQGALCAGEALFVPVCVASMTRPQASAAESVAHAEPAALDVATRAASWQAACERVPQCSASSTSRARRR